MNWHERTPHFRTAVRRRVCVCLFVCVCVCILTGYWNLYANVSSKSSLSCATGKSTNTSLFQAQSAHPLRCARSDVSCAVALLSPCCPVASSSQRCTCPDARGIHWCCVLLLFPHSSAEGSVLTLPDVDAAGFGRGAISSSGAMSSDASMMASSARAVPGKIAKPDRTNEEARSCLLLASLESSAEVEGAAPGSQGFWLHS